MYRWKLRPSDMQSRLAARSQKKDSTPTTTMTASGDALALEARPWRRRVLPLIEYVAEVHAGVKDSSLDGSNARVIPVPLFPGETEDEYEHGFMKSLTKRMKERLKTAPSCASVLGVRSQFARDRVAWVSSNNHEAKIELDVGNLEGLVLEELPRAALFWVKYLRVWDYEREVRSGFFDRLKKMSRAENYTLFGTVLPPVYMPQVSRESARKCEAHFRAWLSETKKLNPLEERARRIEYAVEALRSEKKKKMMKKKAKRTAAEVGSDSETESEDGRDTFAEDVMWQRRVLPLTEYLVEVQSAGSKSQKKKPIPVPLFEGETEEEYEQAFLMTLAESQRKKAAVHNRGNRDLRLHFAKRRAKWCTHDKDQQTFQVDAADLENLSVERLPREALYVIKYVARPPYQAQVRSGFFDRLKTMSRAETVALFRNVVPPIYMPVAHNETAEQCEDRFVQWLKTTKNMTLEDLVNHEDPHEERRYRIEFAATIGMVKEKHKKRKITMEHPANKKQKTKNDSEPDDGCQGSDSIESCVKCGCVKCLAAGGRLLRDRAARVESQRQHSRIAKLVESDAPAANTDDSTGCLETTLVSTYEEINDQVVMNENALEDSASRLAAAPVTDVHETSQLLAENDEMRALIDDEIDKRNAALALLIVFLWREKMEELQSMVNDPAATNVFHIHRASHHKCAALSSQIVEKRKRVDQLESTQSTTAKDHEALVRRTEEELKQLEGQRRREFVRLIRFDGSLRSHIQEALARVSTGH